MDRNLAGKSHKQVLSHVFLLLLAAFAAGYVGRSHGMVLRVDEEPQTQGRLSVGPQRYEMHMRDYSANYSATYAGNYAASCRLQCPVGGSLSDDCFDRPVLLVVGRQGSDGLGGFWGNYARLR